MWWLLFVACAQTGDVETAGEVPTPTIERFDVECQPEADPSGLWVPTGIFVDEPAIVQAAWCNGNGTVRTCVAVDWISENYEIKPDFTAADSEGDTCSVTVMR